MKSRQYISKNQEQRNMSTYTKAKLLEMNADRRLGFNWIKNIENIRETEQAILYSTGDAGLSCGRLYVALPASTAITPDVIKKYNIWI